MTIDRIGLFLNQSRTGLSFLFPSRDKLGSKLVMHVRLCQVVPDLQFVGLFWGSQFQTELWQTAKVYQKKPSIQDSDWPGATSLRADLGSCCDCKEGLRFWVSKQLRNHFLLTPCRSRLRVQESFHYWYPSSQSMRNRLACVFYSNGWDLRNQISWRRLINYCRKKWCPLGGRGRYIPRLSERTAPKWVREGEWYWPRCLITLSPKGL